jgi:hypothetical protein
MRDNVKRNRDRGTETKDEKMRIAGMRDGRMRRIG